jgi:hypothetical protein
MALEFSDGPPMQLLVNGGGLASMILVALIAAWYRRGGRPRARAARLPRSAGTVTEVSHDSSRDLGADRTARGTASGLGHA